MTEYFEILWELLKNGLAVLTLLTVLDFVFGVLVALFIKKDFKWEYLSHFLTSDVLPIFTWVGAVLISTIPAEQIPSGVLPIISGAIYTFVFIQIFSSIMSSFAEIGVLSKPLNKAGFGSPDEDCPQ